MDDWRKFGVVVDHRAEPYPTRPMPNSEDIFNGVLSDHFPCKEDILEWMVKTPKLTAFRIIAERISTENLMKHLSMTYNKVYHVVPDIYINPVLSDVVLMGPVSRTFKGTSNYRMDTSTPIGCAFVDVISGARILRGDHVYRDDIRTISMDATVNRNIRVYIDMKKFLPLGYYNYTGSFRNFIYVGMGYLCMHPSNLFSSSKRIIGVIIHMIERVSMLPAITELNCDTFIRQSLPSICAGKLLDPQQNEFVLEICAAPGDKTIHLVELMDFTGLVVAIDDTANKVKCIFNTVISVSMLEHVRPFVHDIYHFFTPSGGTDRKTICQLNDKTWSPPFGFEVFDRVLLNMPNSGLGRRPCLFNPYPARVIKNIPSASKVIFTNAVAVVKSGGLILYCTNTINPHENEGMVVWALETFPNIFLLDTYPKIGSPGLKYEGLSDQHRYFVQRFGPSDINYNNYDTDGYFICTFQKIS